MTKTSFMKLFQDYSIIQEPEEFWWLYNKVSAISPKVILEIGVEYGGTLKVWETLNPNFMIGLDIDFSRLKYDFTESKSTIVFIEEDSRHDEAENCVKEYLLDEKICFLFIDGAHGYEAVKNDYERYSKYVRKGGIIAFHDYVTEANNVGKFVNELNSPTLEVKHNNGQGVAIIYKD